MSVYFLKSCPQSHLTIVLSTFSEVGGTAGTFFPLYGWGRAGTAGVGVSDPDNSVNERARETCSPSPSSTIPCKATRQGMEFSYKRKPGVTHGVFSQWDVSQAIEPLWVSLYFSKKEKIQILGFYQMGSQAHIYRGI